MSIATAETPLATARPAAPVARTRHLPRRTATATSALRAIDTRALDLGPQAARPGADAASRSAAPADSVAERPAVRSLSARELVTGAGTTAGAWTLAAHLGVLGTAGGTFLISLVSTLGVALVADSLTGARRLLVRLLRRLRLRHQRGTHRTRVRRPS